MEAFVESFARRRRAVPVVTGLSAVHDSQRARILSAMATEACEHGVTPAATVRVTAHVASQMNGQGRLR
jgi:hypothetical protein